MRPKRLAPVENLFHAYGNWSDAACVQAGEPELWFSPPGSLGEARAISLCQSCPFAEECWEYARDNRIRHGIWGGRQREKPKPERASCLVCSHAPAPGRSRCLPHQREHDRLYYQQARKPRRIAQGQRVLWPMLWAAEGER